MQCDLDSWKWSLVLLGAAVLAYASAINNGFIADDFVILARLDVLKTDPLYLLRIAPENFRATSYIVFGALKAAFGADYQVFYAFNILLHGVNVLLLRRLVRAITNDQRLALLSAALFAVFQAPQEAVTWLAAKYGWALAAYTAALFSKESAPVLLMIIPCLEIERGKPAFSRPFFRFLLPTAVFAGIFLYTLRANFMVGHGTYALSGHAVWVWLNSLHRLVWPWGYLLIPMLWMVNGKWPKPATIARAVAWIAALLVPYVFVTYTNAIPSRQLYLASAGFATLMAAGILKLKSRSLQTAFIASFVVFNVGYLWVRKDAQIEERAAPTTALIEELKKHPPQRALIVNFAYPYPEVAKAATRFAPGWQADDIQVNLAPEACRGCLVLTWNAVDRRYEK
jgi:hypothetical protein